MPAKKKPTAVLIAQGSRHYTKAELEERKEAEVKAPASDSIQPPKYLTGTLVKDFNTLAPVLQKMGVLSSLDADLLARYVIAMKQYKSATNHLTEALKAGDVRDADRWSAIQDRFFKQCRACGEDLGLSVSARANLVLPKAFEVAPVDSEEADLFGE